MLSTCMDKPYKTYPRYYHFNQLQNVYLDIQLSHQLVFIKRQNTESTA